METKIDSFSTQNYSELKAGYYKPSELVTFESNCWQLKGKVLPQFELTLAYPCYLIGQVIQNPDGTFKQHANMSELGYYAIVLGDTDGVYNSDAFKKESKLTVDYITNLTDAQIKNNQIPDYYLIEIGNAFYIGVVFLGKSYVVPFAINSFDYEYVLKEIHIYFNPFIHGYPTTIVLKSRFDKDGSFRFYEDFDTAAEQSSHVVTFRTTDGEIMNLSPDLTGHSVKNDYDYLRKFGSDDIFQIQMSDHSSYDDKCASILSFCDTAQAELYKRCANTKSSITKFNETVEKLQPTILSSLSLYQLIDTIPSPMNYQESFNKAMYLFLNKLSPQYYKDFANRGIYHIRFFLSLLLASQCVTITSSPVFNENIGKFLSDTCEHSDCDTLDFMAIDFIAYYLQRNLKLDIKDSRVLDAVINDSFVEIVYNKLAKSFGSIYPESAATALYNKKAVFRAGKSGQATIPGTVPYAAGTIERDAFEWFFATYSLSGSTHMSHLDKYWAVDMLCFGPYITIYNSVSRSKITKATSAKFYSERALQEWWNDEFCRRYPEYSVNGNPMSEGEYEDKYKKKRHNLTMPFLNPDVNSWSSPKVSDDGSIVALTPKDKIIRFCQTYDWGSFSTSPVSSDNYAITRNRCGQSVAWQLIQAGLGPFVSMIPKSLSGAEYSDNFSSPDYSNRTKEEECKKYCLGGVNSTGIMYIVSLFQRIVLSEMQLSKDPACAYKLPCSRGKDRHKYIRLSLSDNSHFYYYTRDAAGLILDSNINGDLDPMPESKGAVCINVTDNQYSNLSDIYKVPEDAAVNLKNSSYVQDAEFFIAPAIIDGNYYASFNSDVPLTDAMRADAKSAFLKWQQVGFSCYSTEYNNLQFYYVCSYPRDGGSNGEPEYTSLLSTAAKVVFASAPTILQQLQAVLALSDEKDVNSFYNKFIAFYTRFIETFKPAFALDSFLNLYKALAHICYAIQSQLPDWSMDSFMQVTSNIDVNAIIKSVIVQEEVKESTETTDTEDVLDAFAFKASLDVAEDIIAKSAIHTNGQLAELPPRAQMLDELLKNIDENTAAQHSLSDMLGDDSNLTAKPIEPEPEVSAADIVSAAVANVEALDNFDNIDNGDIIDNFDSFDAEMSGTDAVSEFDTFDDVSTSDAFDEFDAETGLDDFDTLESSEEESLDSFDDFDDISENADILDTFDEIVDSEESAEANDETNNHEDSINSSHFSDRGSREDSLTTNTAENQLSKQEETKITDSPQFDSQVNPDNSNSTVQNTQPATSTVVDKPKRKSFVGTYVVKTNKDGSWQKAEKVDTNTKAPVIQTQQPAQNVTKPVVNSTVNSSAKLPLLTVEQVNETVNNTIANDSRVPLQEIVYIPSESGTPMWSDAAKTMIAQGTTANCKGIVLAPEKPFTHKPYFIGPGFSHIVDFCNATGAQCFYNADYDMCFVMSGILMFAYAARGNSTIIKRVQSRVRQNGYSNDEFNFGKLSLSSFIS